MEKLILRAKEARDKAYAPYSNFKVGAALMTKTGSIYHGCNIENSSYGLTNCAERTVLFKALSEGVKKEDITHFCIIADTKDVVTPCGACRQVMNELLNTNTKIILTNIQGKIKETSINELLPYAFCEVENGGI